MVVTVEVARAWALNAVAPNMFDNYEVYARIDESRQEATEKLVQKMKTFVNIYPDDSNSF